MAGSVTDKDKASVVAARIVVLDSHRGRYTAGILDLSLVFINGVLNLHLRCCHDTCGHS